MDNDGPPPLDVFDFLFIAIALSQSLEDLHESAAAALLCGDFALYNGLIQTAQGVQSTLDKADALTSALVSQLLK